MSEERTRRCQIFDHFAEFDVVAGSDFTRDQELEDLYAAWLREGSKRNVAVHYVIVDEKRMIVVEARDDDLGVHQEEAADEK